MGYYEERKIGELSYAIIRNGRKYDSGFTLATAIQHARMLSEDMPGDVFKVVDNYGREEFETTTSLPREQEN